jgi:hypothetical protein
MRRERIIVAAIAVAGIVGAAASAELNSGAPQAPTAQESGQPVPSITVIGTRQGTSILSRQVRSKADENIGRIVDVIVDRSGQVRAAVIDFGGFFGVGNRKIAVDWDALDFATDSDKRDFVKLDLTRDQIKTAPEYKDRRAAIVLGAAGAMHPTPYQ